MIQNQEGALATTEVRFLLPSFPDRAPLLCLASSCLSASLVSVSDLTPSEMLAPFQAQSGLDLLGNRCRLWSMTRSLTLTETAHIVQGGLLHELAAHFALLA